MNHERTLHEQIGKIYQRAFAEDSFSVGYPVDRGLTTRRIIDHPEGISAELGYLDLLPKFQGKRVDEAIEAKIDEQGQISLLDVGCGRGRFLMDVKRRWGDKIKPVGTSAFPYHQEEPSYQLAGSMKCPTAGELEELGIPIVIGDAHHLRNNLISAEINPQFDVIVSVMTFGYFVDPLRVLKKVHGSLKPGGIAFINNFDMEGAISFGTHNSLTSYLRDNMGFDFNYEYAEYLVGSGGVAFERTSRELNLPVSYSVKGGNLRYVSKS